MAVNLSKKRIRVLPYRAVIWSVVALVTALVVLQYNPVPVDRQLETAGGMEFSHESDADILVVVDYEAIRQSGDTFSERDFSAVWLDVMYREVGPVSVATPETLSEEMIEEARVLVLTRSVSTRMPEKTTGRIRRQVLDGATVVVERPEGRLRELFSADGDAGIRRGRQITHAAGLEEPYASQLEEMPLATDYVGSTAPREDADTLLSIDGVPVIYAADFGDGQAITVDFDFGRQVVTLQQGRPDEDFTVGDEEARHPPRTADLVADDELLGTPVPYVDLLTRFMIHRVIGRRAAIPALWSFPGGASGAVLFAHEDARLGDGGSWMMEREDQYGGSSTLLTTSDSGLTTEGARKVDDHGGQIGLAWRLPDPSVARWERLGIAGFEPIRRPVGLEAQLGELAGVLERGSVTAARSLDGLWTTDWSAPLAALAARDIRADLSYDVGSHRGYAFGTGHPFLAFNNQGMPLNIREYPVVAPAGAQQGPEVAELLERSATGHHQVLTVATRPSMFADYPDIDRFDDWLGLFDEIRARDHRIVTVAEYAGFQRTRRATSLRSRYDGSAPLPTNLQSEATAPDHTAGQMRVTAEASRRGMELVIPRRTGDREFLGAVEGSERVGEEIVADSVETTADSISGIPVHRVELERGFNTLEFYYR